MPVEEIDLIFQEIFNFTRYVEYIFANITFSEFNKNHSK